MNARGLLVVGAIAGIVFAATPQGRKLIDEGRRKLQDVWSSPDVQRTVAGVSDQVRNVPVVGDRVADVIKSNTR